MDEIVEKKRVLLYLGKFPGYGFDVDGGSILARQLIDTLKRESILDVVFIRKNDEFFNDSAVNQVRYVKYKDAMNNKFVRRLENLETNREAIGDYRQYDVIVAAHISKFFGFEDYPEQFWKRTVLFPMFVTSSYIRAGEEVPLAYTDLEAIVVSKVGHIIVPSKEDLMNLVSDYQIDPSKITVIYRGIDPVFVSRGNKDLNKKLHMACIGSIKKQKNNLDALRVLAILREKGIDAELTFICTIQDKVLYTDMVNYASENGLDAYVRYLFRLNQSEVATVLGEMDINISVSNWETFGRGIFEGVTAGLPTFVYSRLTCVSEICSGNPGICFAINAEDMASKILDVYKNDSLFQKMKMSLPELSARVSYHKEREALIGAIIG